MSSSQKPILSTIDPAEVSQARKVIERYVPDVPADQVTRRQLNEGIAQCFEGKLEECSELAHMIAERCAESRAPFWVLLADSLHLAARKTAELPDVVEKRMRSAADRKRRAVTDEQIDDAVAQSKTQVEAAEKLGISDRQLRTRIKNRKR